MTEPPHKRARRPEGKQMRDEPNRAPARERDGRRDGRNDDRESNRDRDRRYRSRSPRGDRDRNGGRNRDRERGGRENKESRGGRDRDERGDGRRDNERRPGGRGGIRENVPDSREKPRERSRDRQRSRSPRHEKEEKGDINKEKERDKPKLSVEEVFTKERTATPPVSFRVAPTSRPASSHSTQDHDRMDVDGDVKPLKIKSSKGAKGARAKKIEAPIEDDEEIVIEDDGMAAMQAMMGFGGFGTTQNKKVPGNDVSAVRKEKKTEYRQYMNRVGGFNRPLSPSHD